MLENQTHLKKHLKCEEEVQKELKLEEYGVINSKTADRVFITWKF